MVTRTYQDFDVLITRSPDGYTARVVNSPAGQASIPFSLPFSELELGELLMRFRPPRRGSAEVARKFGGQLFDALFDGEMLACLRSSIDAARKEGAGLRIRLRLGEVPELADLPWEYLYHAALDRFLALSADTPLVRYMEMPETVRALAIEPPLNVLVVIASPADYPALDTGREWNKMQQALRDLRDRKQVGLERLETASLAALQQRLRQGDYHIVHFIGHGDFDEQNQIGTLVLEDESKKGYPVSGDSLGALLHDHNALRLVVLNACEGARASTKSAFSGVAQNLVQQAIPAVIAMQFPVSDAAAITLAQEFYGALADGYPVDASLGEARKAVFSLGDTVEWGTPVLYMRSPDGYIFDIAGKGRAMTDKDAESKKGGGIHISVGGSVSGKIEAAEGDIVHGDKITVGDISGSSGVAIGRGAQAAVNQGTTTIFADAYARLDELGLPDFKKNDAREAVKTLEEESKAEQPDQDRVDIMLSKLEDLAPDVVELLINAFTNPGAAVGKGIKLAIKTWRETRKRKE